MSGKLPKDINGSDNGSLMSAIDLPTLILGLRPGARRGRYDMIQLTRLNSERFALNTDLIERVESTPDTVLTLIDGTKYLVSEPMEDVIERVVHFRARIVAVAGDPDTPSPLHLVPDPDSEDSPDHDQNEEG